MKSIASPPTLDSRPAFRLAHTFPMPIRHRLIALACALALSACATHEVRPVAPAEPPAAAVAPQRVVPERFIAQDDPADELDSLTTWPSPDGATWLIATAKSTHRLVVFDGDTGRRLRDVGGKGTALGRFTRPNGIATFGDRLFVVERDNRRVQVMSLPAFTPLGSFGADALRSPYGLWMDETAPDEFTVYVTDSFMDGAKFDVVPPTAQLDHRVHRFSVTFDEDNHPTARDAGTFGSTDPVTSLRIVESIAGDPAQRRLLVADEKSTLDAGRTGSTLREYAFDGAPTGRHVADGSFQFEAEGVALWACTADTGYWLAVDQTQPLTRFLLFDRTTLAPRGVFTGETTAGTDGIALHAAATAQFPFGALYAVHADRAVAAFDLGDVVRALQLDPACAP